MTVQREVFFTWLEAHGINPDHVVSVEFDPLAIQKADGVHMKVTTLALDRMGNVFACLATDGSAGDAMDVQWVPLQSLPGEP